MDTRAIAQRALERNRARPRPMPPEAIHAEKLKCRDSAAYFIHTYCPLDCHLEDAVLVHRLLFHPPTMIITSIDADELKSLADLYRKLPAWLQVGIEADDSHLQLKSGSAIINAKVDDE